MPILNSKEYLESRLKTVEVTRDMLLYELNKLREEEKSTTNIIKNVFEKLDKISKLSKEMIDEKNQEIEKYRQIIKKQERIIENREQLIAILEYRIILRS